MEMVRFPSCRQLQKLVQNQIKTLSDMRSLFLFALISVLISPALHAQQPVYLDTLEVEIGDNTKVIFLAKSPADFAVIDRYDLNFLFDELWRMRQEGLTGEESLDQYSAEQLRAGVKAPEVIKGVTGGLRLNSWFFTTNAGFTIGRSFLVTTRPFLLSEENQEQLQYTIRGEIRSKTAVDFTFGNSILLKEQGTRKWRLRVGIGASLVNYRIRNVRRGSLRSLTEGSTLSSAELEELVSDLPERILDKQIGAIMPFLEIGPYYEWYNRRPEGRWSVSLGGRLSTVISDDFNRIPIYELGESEVLFSHSGLQYGLTAHLGYSFSNLFVNYYPNAFQLDSNVRSEALQVPGAPNRTRNLGLWVVGTRFGF